MREKREDEAVCIGLSLPSYKELLSEKKKKIVFKQFLQFSTGSINVRAEPRLVKFLDAFRVN